MNQDILKIVIAEDNSSSRKLLRRFLSFIPNVVIVGEAENGEELVELVKSRKADLALVDVHMPKLNGFEAILLALNYDPKLKFIFITGSEDFAVDAFNISAIDYIVKPIQPKRLFDAIDKVKKFMLLDVKTNLEGSESSLNKPESIKQVNDKLIVKFGSSYYFIPYNQILFIEKVDRKSYIHTVAKTYEVYKTLQTLQDKLPDTFIQTHRSYLVNFEHVSNIKSSGETFLIYFHDYDKPAYISKNKIHLIQKIIK